jgi:hypothetical protein
MTSTQALPALAALAASLMLFSAPSALAEGHQRDSDDFNCNHGPSDAAYTIEACARLRGISYRAAARQMGRETGIARDSDDLFCVHGQQDLPRTAEACARVRSYYWGGRR